jgi:hypothetical protein
MFGLFKKKNPIEKLQAEYRKLMEEAFHLSKSDRKAGDAKIAEADQILKKIEALQKNQ